MQGPKGRHRLSKSAAPASQPRKPVATPPVALLAGPDPSGALRVALAVFAVGSLVRFDRDQYTWKSDSSQFLRAGQLRWGSNLFHIGILGALPT